MTTYRITIEKVENISITESVWKELSSDTVFKDTVEKDLLALHPDDYPKQNGYVEVESTKEVKTEIFKQSVDKEPDMMEVIKAFNGAK